MKKLFIPAVLVLEDGSIFHGTSVGSIGIACGEVVFNTSMTGYQEIITDPSYAKQIIAFTYPQIGNVGVNKDDAESEHIWAAGLIMRQMSSFTSNWRAEASLVEYLKHHNIVAIANIDTRELTQKIRIHGALRGCIMTGNCNTDEALSRALAVDSLNEVDLTSLVSTPCPYEYVTKILDPSLRRDDNGIQMSFDVIPDSLDVMPAQAGIQYKVVVYDFGVKRSILQMLATFGCKIIVVPANTSAEEALSFYPTGIVLSNGPGDPMAYHQAITTIQTFIKMDIPLFGICLGHQLLALSLGAKTVKMKFGHHGANHPVQDLLTKKIMITNQNHGFMVDANSLPNALQPTHRSLFDGSLQGIRHLSKPFYGFQGHPEAGPGPQDALLLFKPFLAAMQTYYQQSEHSKNIYA